MKPADLDCDDEPPSREEQLIHAFTGRTAGAGPRPTLGPGDDAALTADGTVVSVDVLVEGVHFTREWSPEDLGFKVIAVSVSDLAAMGAKPEWALLTVSGPARRLNASWAKAFERGLHEACDQWNIALIGGDTTGALRDVSVGATLGGRCVAAPLQRDGASPGDEIWTTGRLGIAGRAWRSDTPDDRAIRAHRRPEPPLPFALDLAKGRLATAAMDISDGLAVDLPRLAKASGCAMEVDAASVQRAGEGSLEDILCGGEDYELLFTAPPRVHDRIRSLAHHHGIQVHRIGLCREGAGAHLPHHAWPTTAWSHFAGAS